ncbi:MAG: PDZ domain-containing protein, partial [Parasporobacterium sp.]|nr:PDZ domain-containing protein [Parasporobacterium sp.]
MEENKELEINAVSENVPESGIEIETVPEEEAVSETESPLYTDWMPKRRTPRGQFLKGMAAGIVLSGLVFVLARGYLTIPVGKDGTLTLKLPYYERLHGSGAGRLDHAEIDRKMDEIQKLIDKSYLYDADPATMTEGIFTGMIYGLSEDDYAIYYSKENFANEKKRLNGSYVGIGVAVTTDIKTNGLLVESVTYNSPAQEVGIMVGDVLLKANGTDLTAISSDEAISYVTGPEGTEVVLEVLRDGVTMEVTAVRRV